MLIESLRKQLGLQAHTVTKVEETERYRIVHIDRLGLVWAAAWRSSSCRRIISPTVQPWSVSSVRPARPRP